MGTGIAGALLVFTGIWHAVEWLMYGRNRDTLRLIPIGLAYLLLGYLIVMGIGGWTVPLVALVLTSAGLAGAVITRRTAQVPGWVTWAFILIDVAIIAGLIAGMV